ncbi:MAG: hypothetical protein AMXMBFR59_12410 [Rhodanobacteraceae bacterium]
MPRDSGKLAHVAGCKAGARVSGQLLNHHIDALASHQADALVAASAWLAHEGVEHVRTEMAGILGLKFLPSMAGCHAVRQGLATTAHEQSTLLLSARFYEAQTAMFAAEATRYATRIAHADFPAMVRFGDAAVHELSEGLRDLLLDALVLLEQAGHALLACPGAYGVWSRRFDLPFEIYKAAEQVTYGKFSLLTHIDRAPFVGIALLRVAIETRLRAAFCVYAYEDAGNRSIQPIGISELLEAIGLHCPSAAFAVDRHDVAKIYRWTNFYLHAGRRDFCWTPGFALQYVRPFVSGQSKPDGSWSMNNGILVPRAEWEAVQQHFASKARDGQTFPIAPAEAAACTVV